MLLIRAPAPHLPTRGDLPSALTSCQPASSQRCPGDSPRSRCGDGSHSLGLLRWSRTGLFLGSTPHIPDLPRVPKSTENEMETLLLIPEKDAPKPPLVPLSVAPKL